MFPLFTGVPCHEDLIPILRKDFPHAAPEGEFRFMIGEEGGNGSWGKRYDPHRPPQRL